MSKDHPNLLRLKCSLLRLLLQVLWSEQIDLLQSGLHYDARILHYPTTWKKPD